MSPTPSTVEPIVSGLAWLPIWPAWHGSLSLNQRGLAILVEQDRGPSGSARVTATPEVAAGRES